QLGRIGWRDAAQQLGEHRIEEVLAGIAIDAADLLAVLDQHECGRDVNGAGERNARAGLVADGHTPQRRLLSLAGFGIGGRNLRVPAPAPHAARIVEHQQLGGLPDEAREEGGQKRQGPQTEPRDHRYDPVVARCIIGTSLATDTLPMEYDAARPLPSSTCGTCGSMLPCLPPGFRRTPMPVTSRSSTLRLSRRI